jgi:RecA-family ATPase
MAKMGFQAVEESAAASGARDPAAVAASIGRKKYGKAKFQAMASAGRKKKRARLAEYVGK